MGAEAAESRETSGSAGGHSQSSAEPDLAAGAAVEIRPSTEELNADVPIASWKTSKPLLRDCNYGGSFCELLAVEAVQEYLNFHGLQETQKALVQSQCPAMLSSAFTGIRVSEHHEVAVPHPGGASTLVQAELAVMQALRDFDDGKRELFLQKWNVLVPPSGPNGGSMELRLRVYFGTYKTRQALLANDPDTPLPEPDFSDLKAFLSSRPSAMGADPSSSLSSLYALPFVPQPHQNSALRFIFEEPWSQQLRSDVQAFMTAYTSTRHAPSLRQLAGWMIASRCPLASPPPASWLELLRLAEISINAASQAVAKLQTSGSPAPQSLEHGDANSNNDRQHSSELLNWLGSGGRKMPELQKQVVDLRKRLGAVASRHPNDEPPSVQETPGSMRPSIQSLVRDQSSDWEPQGVSTPVPLLQDRLWPREALRGSSASSLNASHSNAGAVRRLHSARSIESRARTATALLPVPPALDFGRIAAVLNGEATEDTPPILSVLRAVLRRLALPDEAIRPRRAFLAAFACFGAVRALAGKLPEMVTREPALLEMSLAVMGVCACEVVGRREIEAAEAQGTGCISSLISIVAEGQRSLQHEMHCLAVLQRLSLRGRLQSKMIQLGALDVVLKLLQSVRKAEGVDAWCRLGPGEGPETPDFSIEFTSALLMNLTLRSAGRRRCAELGAYKILVGLIEHPNAQVRTHINGTLYTLLGVKAIRSEAQKSHAEVVFRSALERVSPENELLQRQLEFLLHQLSCGGDSDGEDSEDGDPPQAIGSPEDGGASRDADDGDNFLDEEELAAHFHLASTSAVGPGDGYSQAEIDANSKAAAAEAAAAEEALRHFRAAGAVADSQQRLFHAFIARSCRNLMSPKRRGSSDRLVSSPLSPPMDSPSSASPEPGLKPSVPPVTVTSSTTTVETPPSRREPPPMDPYQEVLPPSKGSGIGGPHQGAGKSAQPQVQPAQERAKQNARPGRDRQRPESRQTTATTATTSGPSADASEARGGRSVPSSTAGGKGRQRGTRVGPSAGAANNGTSTGTAVTKSASLPPLPENKASGRGAPAAQPSARARSEAPKRSQQAAVAAVEVAASVGQDRGFRKPRNSSKTTSSERQPQAKESNAQLPQLPKRR